MAVLSRNPRSRPHGFSLIDVMMGATLLVVGLMGMIQAITIGSEMMATAQRQTLAAQIINHEIEKLRLSSWTTISGLAAGPTSVTIDSQFSAAITANGLVSGTTLTLSRSVSDVVSGTLREVVFTVTWTMKPSGLTSSRTYTRVMSAYYGKYGIGSTYQRS
jgi:Tfp pilus assembly protein PilV